MADWTKMMRSELRNLSIGAKIVFGSGAELALGGEHIAYLNIDEGVDGALMPGDVLSATLEMELINDSGQWLEGGAMLGHRDLIGATIMPTLTATDGENEEVRSLGVFQIHSAKALEKEAKMRIEAADSISFELGKAFSDGLEYPQTLNEVFRHTIAQSRYVCSGGIPNGDILIEAAPNWGEILLRQAIGYIAAACGCFVCVDREGALELRPVWKSDICEIEADAYLTLESDSASFGPVDSLECSDAQYFAEEAALCTLSVSGNPLIESNPALAQAMLDRIAGYRMAGLRFDWRGDPEIGVGDRIAILDTAGRRLESVLTRQSMSYKNGFSATCACVLPDDDTSGMQRAITPEGGLNANALVGTVNASLLSIGGITTNKLAAGSVTAEKLAVGAVDAQSIRAISAKISALTAEDISTDSLAAGLAAFTVLTAGTAEFDRATVAHLVAKAMNLEFGTADEVFIRNLSVEYAQMVGAAIGNLCIKASDGKYYAIDVDESGNVIATNTTLTEGEIAAGQTDAGRVILETSITAESLNTVNLLATYALINRIDAARIDVDALLAREAFISKLITSQIFADGSSLEIVAAAARSAQSTAENAQTAAAKAQTVADAAVPYVEFQRVIRINEDGLHVGDNQSGGEVLIDSESVNVVMSGQKYSRFAANYVQFGRYQLRKSADGGLVFKLQEE